uniref:NADH-plastoquinone oxidoreductase subunit J n=2 Tax=Selaginella TaxID=3246 RepID=A0A482A342_SELUN|nr:NADH-plastoquinone oxidoreductase subunit J [Selaginella uncinata]YP_009589517.1 NADH-plastoquinone oxidoreductase subunit J [Selaginella hainanensis]QBL07872.1 NADH-plastoquinone oxidoreductase subunit J [Selaginella uncinata]QBL76098.1 NADH-plastoquinone oxidoreductase subunit J [Selaginella hainanensis]
MLLDACATSASDGKVQGQLPARLAEHESAHRPPGFDHQGIEIPQIQSEDRPSVAVASYVYGSNHPRAQCARDAAPGGLSASVHHPAKVQDDADQPEELCIKASVSKKHPRIPSVLRVRKSADLQERESHDMSGTFHESHPRLKRIPMPDTRIGRPPRKDHTVPDFHELQDSFR